MCVIQFNTMRYVYVYAALLMPDTTQIHLIRCPCIQTWGLVARDLQTWIPQKPQPALALRHKIPWPPCTSWCLAGFCCNSTTGPSIQAPAQIMHLGEILRTVVQPMSMPPKRRHSSAQAPCRDSCSSALDPLARPPPLPRCYSVRAAGRLQGTLRAGSALEQRWALALAGSGPVPRRHLRSNSQRQRQRDASPVARVRVSGLFFPSLRSFKYRLTSPGLSHPFPTLEPTSVCKVPVTLFYSFPILSFRSTPPFRSTKDIKKQKQ